MIKVMVVDDHTVFRQAIVGQIQSIDMYSVIAEADSGNSAVNIAANLSPDVIIMDISLPDIDGIEAAKKIKTQGCKCKIILLSMYNYSTILDTLNDIGIDGYLLKNDAFNDLTYAINAVYEGKKYISSSLLNKKKYRVSPHIPSLTANLTKREKEIIYLIALGFSNKEIGKKLFISPKTVEKHRANLMKKIGVKNIAELVRYAIRAGIIEP